MTTLERVVLPFIRPLQGLLEDPEVTEVMVNSGGARVFVERHGTVEGVPDLVLDGRHLTVGIRNIARACGNEVSEANPILDARLEDGSRVAAMFPPCALDGAVLTIRKFTRRYSLDELVAHRTLTEDEASQLTRALHDRQTMLIAGGTGTGKTTLLNALAALIPAEERIIVIEDTSEIWLPQPDVLRFEARRQQPALGQEEALPEVTTADLLRATLRHRPDRIILGEVRGGDYRVAGHGGEAYDLLQALNTGHEGSLSTIHANSAGQALVRFAHCVLATHLTLPHRSVREAIAQAIHVVVHLVRDTGRRRVSQVVTIEGYDRGLDRFRLVPLAGN